MPRKHGRMLGAKQKGAFCGLKGGNEIVLKRFNFKDLKNGIFLYCFLFAALCLLSSCATSDSLELLRQDVSRLNKENLAIKNEMNILREKTTGVAKEDSFHNIRQSQAEIQAMMSNVSRDIQVLNGRFDENKYFVEKTLKNSTTEMDIVKAQITSLESQVKSIRDKLTAIEPQATQQKEILQKQTTATEEPEKEPQHPIPVKPASSDKASRYDEAYAAFKDQKYKEARKLFEAFMKDYPKDDLIDNAQFWIAETYYGEKDFEGAILAYEMLLKKYPKSEKSPSALLKQGLSFIEIGDKKTGKVILDQLRERYPNSREAELAKKHIEELTKKNTKKKK